MQTLGYPGSPSLQAQATESGTVLRFAVHMAHRFKLVLAHGQALAVAGDALETYLALTRSTGLCLSPTERQGLMDAVVRYLVCAGASRCKAEA